MPTYLNCMASTQVQTHDIFRVTLVPSEVFGLSIGGLLTRWPDAARGVFDSVAGGLCYPVQGEPTIIDNATAGKVCVFDVKANANGVGRTVQQLAQSVTDSYPTTQVQQVERLQLISELADTRPTQQDATAEQVGAAVQAAGSWWTRLGTAAKWGVVAIVALAVIAVAVKIPKSN